MFSDLYFGAMTQEQAENLLSSNSKETTKKSTKKSTRKSKRNTPNFVKKVGSISEVCHGRARSTKEGFDVQDLDDHNKCVGVKRPKKSNKKPRVVTKKDGSTREIKRRYYKIKNKEGKLDYVLNSNDEPMFSIGSKTEVYHEKAHHTTGGLIKKDLIKNKNGKIVSKAQSEAGVEKVKTNPLHNNRWLMAMASARKEIQGNEYSAGHKHKRSDYINLAKDKYVNKYKKMSAKPKSARTSASKEVTKAAKPKKMSAHVSATKAAPRRSTRLQARTAVRPY